MYKELKNIFITFCAGFGEYITLIFGVIFAAIKRPPSWSLIREQLYNIGVLSWTVVAITGTSTGLVLAVQSFYQLADKGLSGVTGIMVSKAMITELGPILTALMVTGRIGSAMCAELGTMKVTEQVDAMQTMAVDPKRYLLAPRYIASVIMLPLLTCFSVILGILGGYAISSAFFGMPAANYFDPMPIYVTTFDLVTGFVKSIIYAIFMVTICCYKGIKTKGGAAGVGRSTTSSVVITYVTILVSDFLITIALNSIHEKILLDFN